MTKAKESPANKQASGKRGGKRSTSWKKGQSGNPAGAPKRGQSWTELIKEYGDLTPSEAAAKSLELARELLKIGDGVTLKQAVVLRVYASLLFEPQPGLFTQILDRAEGKVTQPVELTWREEAKAAGVSPEEIDRMADALFAKAIADASDSAE